MNTSLPLEEITVLNRVNFVPRKRIWYNDVIWGILREYPSALRKKFEDLMDFTYSYQKGGYNSEFFLTAGLDYEFFWRFTKNLIKYQDLERAFVNSNGLNYELGYHWSIFKVRRSFFEHRLAQSQDSLLLSIRYRCKKGAFQIYGIMQWDDLFVAALPDCNHFDDNRKKICGKAGLERAGIYLRHLLSVYKRIPRWDDNGTGIIIWALRKKVWSEFGINYWADLLRFTFGPNISVHIHWKGKFGLERARQQIKIYYEKYRKLPSSNDKEFNRIKIAIQHHYWDEFGIYSWQEFTLKTIGLMKPRIKYAKGADLVQVKKTMLDSFELNHKLPTAKDFHAIEYRARKKVWIREGIGSWNDLLQSVFGRVNSKKNKWAGIEGLTRAREILRKIYQTQHQIPSYQDPAVNNIYYTIHRKVWVVWGIKTWKDLLRTTFAKWQFRKPHMKK